VTRDDWTAEDQDNDVARQELRHYWVRVDGEASNAEDFYRNVAALIRRAPELSDAELEHLADLVAPKPWVPWKRSRKGAPLNEHRRLWVWAECFTFVGTITRGGKKGDPLPTKAEALDLIKAKFDMDRDAARKLYEAVERDGPPL
jgi:hypothetical protein